MRVGGWFIGAVLAAGCGQAPEAGECGEAARACGEVAPPARVDVSGLSSEWLSGERQDEPVTLVVFFELWCPHCREEIPRLMDIHGMDGIEVVGLTRLSRDTAPDRLRSFLTDRHVDYAVGRDTGGLADRLGIRGVPSAVAVRGGTVLWQGHPAELTEAQLEGWRQG